MNVTTPSVSSRSFVREGEKFTFDDHQDVIWPSVFGLFVALALGWMICRYKCSSKERSAHLVRCCPKSLCQPIRSCCRTIYRLSKPVSEPSTSDPRLSLDSGRASEASGHDISLFLQPGVKDQWPTPFLMSDDNRDRCLFPHSMSIESEENGSSEPQRQHPLRREPSLPPSTNTYGEIPWIQWPFQTTNINFHDETNDIKATHLFFHT